MAPPDDYGWAYIDPQRASASADGPEDSVQFRYGSIDLSPGQFSGSQDFTFLSNDMVSQGGVGSGSQLFVTGNVYVSGTIYADTYTIKEVTSFQIDHSGSTIFGDSADDTHQRTGSLEVSNTAVFSATVQASEYIYHQGDLDTFIRFQADDIDIQAGGVDFIKITEDGSQDLVRINPANADVDFIVSTSQSSGSFKIDGATGDIHFGGDQMVFDHSVGELRIRPGATKQGVIKLHSRDGDAADEAQLQFMRYTDGTFAEGDNLGIIQFRGAEDEDGTYYTAASIIGEVDEAGWADGSSTAGRLLFYTTADGATTGTKRIEIGSDGAVEITGSFEVSGPAHFTSEVHAEAELNVGGTVTLGSDFATGVTTFYNTLTGASANAYPGGDIHANKVIVNDLYVSGSTTGVIATSVSGTQVDPRSYSYLGWETSGYLKASGSLTLGGSATIGTTLIMPDNTSAKILVADGSSYQEVAVTGDATISNAGAITIAASAVEGSMLADNVISGQGALGSAAVAQADLLMLDDGPGTVKKVTFSNFEDSIFANVSGDATVAAGGALTIAAAAVEHGMVAETVIGSATNLGATAAQADELLIYDANASVGGRLKAITISNLEDTVFGNISGDATVAAGGALTIGNQAVENSMLADDAVGADELAANAVVNDSVVDGSIRVDKFDIDGSTDISADLDDADLFIVDDGAAGTNRKAAASRIKTYTKTDATPAVAAAGKAVILGGSKNIATLGAVGCGAITSTGASTFGSISGSSTLSSLGAAHLGGTLTMDGAGIVFNVASTAGTVSLQVNDGDGADAAIILAKSGKVTKIGDDTPSDGQYLSWDALGGKVAWADGLTVWGMSGSDAHYSSTELRTSGDLNVSGSAIFGTGADGQLAILPDGTLTSQGNISGQNVTAAGDLIVTENIIHVGDVDTKIRFTNDQIDFYAGNVVMLTLDEQGNAPNPDNVTIPANVQLTASGDLCAANKIMHADDDDTFFEFSSNDWVKITVGGSEALSIKEAGTNHFSIGNGFCLTASDGIAVDRSIYHKDDFDTSIEFTSDQIDFVCGGVTMMTLDEAAQDVTRFNPANADIDFMVSTTQSSGSLLIDGDTGDIHFGGDIMVLDHSDASLTIRPMANATSNQAKILLHSLDTDANDEAQLQFKRYTDGSFAAGDNLGIIQFRGAEDEDGAYYTAASIFAEVDEAGWADGSSAAGRLLFYTTADGATTGTERMRIDSAGLVTLAGDLTVTGNDIKGSGGTAITFSGVETQLAGDLRVNGNDIKDSGGNTVISFDGAGAIDNDLKIQSNSAQIKLVSDSGQSSIDFYGRGDAMADGDNVGALRFYGTEVDGDGSGHQMANIYTEVADDNFGPSSRGGKIRMQVCVNQGTTLQDAITIDGGTNHTAYPYVGIGTTDPPYKFSVQESHASSYIAQIRQESSNASANCLRVRSANSSGGNFITFSDNGGSNKGHITVNGSTVTYGAFTGYHPAGLPEADDATGYDYGTIVKISSVDSDGSQKVVHYSVEKTAAAQDKSAFGVYAGKKGVSLNDDGTPDDESEKHQIFALGDGHILVCSENGDIETGDFICSSNTAGHGMKQSDDLMHSYTVAKSSESVDWAAESSSTKLVACTYHAG